MILPSPFPAIAISRCCSTILRTTTKLIYLFFYIVTSAEKSFPAENIPWTGPRTGSPVPAGYLFTNTCAACLIPCTWSVPAGFGEAQRQTERLIYSWSHCPAELQGWPCLTEEADRGCCGKARRLRGDTGFADSWRDDKRGQRQSTRKKTSTEPGWRRTEAEAEKGRETWVDGPSRCVFVMGWNILPHPQGHDHLPKHTAHTQPKIEYIGYHGDVSSYLAL